MDLPLTCRDSHSRSRVPADTLESVKLSTGWRPPSQELTSQCTLWRVWDQLSGMAPSLPARTPLAQSPSPLASNHSVHTGGKVKPEEKYCPKPSGPGYIPDQCGDCHHTWEKPNFLRALNSGPSGPNPTPERAVRAIEQRSSPSSHLVLALAPSTPDLFPTRAVTATTP